MRALTASGLAVLFGAGVLALAPPGTGNRMRQRRVTLGWRWFL